MRRFFWGVGGGFIAAVLSYGIFFTLTSPGPLDNAGMGDTLRAVALGQFYFYVVLPASIILGVILGAIVASRTAK